MNHRSLARVSGGRAAGRKVSLLFDFSHSRQALLSVAQPGLGALLAQGGFPSLRTIGMGLIASTAGMLCVYAANDLLDLRVDRAAVRSEASPKIADGYDIDVVVMRHPVALGVLSIRVASAWVICLGLIAVGFAYLIRPGCAIIFGACAVLEVAYCGLKTRTWLKTVPSGAMVGLGGLAGWYAVRDFDYYAVAFFFLLALWEIFGRNVSNDLADVSHDLPLGIKTLAAVHGRKWAARVSFWGTVATLSVAALQPGSSAMRLMLVATAGWTMVLPAIDLVRTPEERAAQRLFNRASLFPPLAFAFALVLFAMGAGV